MSFRSASVFLFAALALTTGCARRSHGHDKPVNESRAAAGDFTEVESKGSADVVVIVGPATAIDVKCSEAAAALRLRTHVEKTKLVIETESGGLLEVHDDDCTVTVKMPKLEAVNLRGSGSLTVEGAGEGLSRIALAGSGDVTIASARSGQVDLSVEGSGTVTIRELTATDVSAKVTGSGDMKTAGSARNLKVVSHGSGTVDARTLRVEEASVRSNGSSEVQLFASRKADVEASGSGDVLVLGHPPDRHANIHGSGSVRWE